MAKRKADQTQVVDVQEVKEGAGTRSFSLQALFDQYQQYILYAMGGIILLFAGWWLYKTMIVAPRQKEAVESMWQAEQMFGRDSFQLALDGTGMSDGFLAIADKYSGTAAGNSARYYAAVCYLQLGNFDEAINQMDRYSAKGEFLPAMKNGILGDCYSEKEDFGKALSYYKKAADATDNDLIAAYYLRKLGMLYEHQGNTADALKTYERLRRDYPNPQSADWREVEKYIYRAGGGK